MAYVHETVTIHAAPQAVWDLVGDPGRIGDWVPVLAGSALEGDERTCTTQDGGRLRERILEHSDEERYYAYTISESDLPLTEYDGRLSVTGHGDHSHVDWEARFETESPEQAEELEGVFSQIFQEALVGVRERFERHAT